MGQPAMRLDLLADDPALPPIEIGGLTADSRAVVPGDLFAALSGAHADGRRYVAQAVERGAVAVLAAPGEMDLPPGIARIVDAEPRSRLARMAARQYAPQPETLVAVTGTNGKTSVASFVRQIWAGLGHRSASIGTLGVVAEGIDIDLAMTTPDPVALHKALATLATAGITCAALEASSHGLDQHRLDGCRFQAAAFTNLTRDHLDYHHDLDAYRAAKLRLFADLLPARGTAVINRDSPEFEAFASVSRGRGQRVLAVGGQGADLILNALTPLSTGLEMSVTYQGWRGTLTLPLAGTFQASNALVAAALVIACGAEARDVLPQLERLDGVPGRLERVGVHPGGAPVYVDYAHTPDALETVLSALRPHVTGRLVVVFGCGGDRDPGKRPQMGAIAARLADRAIVTDDNPRSEQPAAIRAAILAACANGIEIGDRAEAIATAVADLGAGDVLLVAGKGHEQGQTAGGVTRPFDDRVQARRALQAVSA
ncbi:UDP-N-acetylmuramoyl-L-alanyl-D-glutamate--2,6-diaminopimelate ligase [Zavarzinia sp. CC-PAN008]|uniref:UDP-N-acetylmuramoyl-L-alanyl-D-glutamate--2, 6-diaminopimelate ligase n=1 Tax=Zavarzinia sp. CC-PAN008 TaxID=3243332 RepID=UPI003F7455EF